MLLLYHINRSRNGQSKAIWTYRGLGLLLPISIIALSLNPIQYFAMQTNYGFLVVGNTTKGICKFCEWTIISNKKNHTPSPTPPPLKTSGRLWCSFYTEKSVDIHSLRNACVTIYEDDGCHRCYGLYQLHITQITTKGNVFEEVPITSWVHD